LNEKSELLLKDVLEIKMDKKMRNRFWQKILIFDFFELENFKKKITKMPITYLLRDERKTNIFSF